MQLMGGLDAVAALEVRQGLAGVGGRGPDDLVVLDLVLGDLPRGCEHGEEGDGAEGQADGDCRPEGEPPACVDRQLAFRRLTPCGGSEGDNGGGGATYRFCFCLCSGLGGSCPYGPPKSSFFLSSGGIGE